MNCKFNMVDGYKIHYMYVNTDDKIRRFYTADYYTENKNDDMMDITLLDNKDNIIVKSIVPCKFNREMLHCCEYN